MRRVTPSASSMHNARVPDTSIDRTDGSEARADGSAPHRTHAERRHQKAEALGAEPEHVLGQERHVHAEVEDAEAHDKTSPMASRSRGVPAA